MSATPTAPPGYYLQPDSFTNRYLAGCQAYTVHRLDPRYPARLGVVAGRDGGPWRVLGLEWAPMTYQRRDVVHSLESACHSIDPRRANRG